MLKLFKTRRVCEVPTGWSLRFYRESVVAVYVGSDHATYNAPRMVELKDIPVPFDQWPEVKMGEDYGKNV